MEKRGPLRANGGNVVSTHTSSKTCGVGVSRDGKSHPVVRNIYILESLCVEDTSALSGGWVHRRISGQ